MSNDKPKANKPEAKAKESKPKLDTIANKAKARTGKEYSSREAFVDDILAEFKASGQTHNVKGREITKTNCTSQVNAIIRDIVAGTKSKNSWHNQRRVEDDEKHFAILMKE